MNIEEKIKNAENLFRNYYLAKGVEEVKLGDRILKENGFGEDFWDMICPVLQKKGVLKGYSYEIIIAGTLDVYENYANPRDVEHLDARIHHIERELEWQYAKAGIISAFSEGERVEKIRDIKKQLKELKDERTMAERVHCFKINADYFKDERNRSLENPATAILQVGSDKRFNFENEKRDIAAIDSADDHKIVADKWLNIKLILDGLFKLLAPINKSETQVVSLKPQFLPLEQNLLFPEVLIDMLRTGVIGDPPRTTSPGVVNGNLTRKVLMGDYIPIKVAALKVYRRKISDLVAWIEQDGVERFSQKQTGGQNPSGGTPLEKLSPVNFLSVCDVAMDIEEKLQMTDKDVVYIPIVKKNNIRFPILLPAVAANLFDEYGDNRVRGAIYLKNNGSILKISLELKKFRQYYDGLLMVYRERVVDPVKQEGQAGDAKLSMEETPDETVAMTEDVVIEVAQPSKNAHVKLSGNVPTFNVNNGKVFVGDLDEVGCYIADMGDFQHHICEQVLAKRTGYNLGDWVTQQSLQDIYTQAPNIAEIAGASVIKSDFSSDRWLRDAVRLVNGKFNKKFGVNLLQHNKSRVRVIAEHFKG